MEMRLMYVEVIKLTTINNTYNATIDGFEDYNDVMRALVIGSATIMTIGIVGNLTVMWTIIRSPSIHVPMYVTVASLALADTLTLVFAPSAAIMNWDGSDNVFTCYAFVFMARTMQFASALHHILISCERYVAVRHPLHARSIVTNAKTLKAIALVYVVSVLIFVDTLFATTFEHKHCTMGHHHWQKIFDLFQYGIRAVVPIIVLVILNISIAVVMRERAKQHRRLAHLISDAGHPTTHLVGRYGTGHPLIMMGLVILFYLILTCPVCVFIILQFILPSLGVRLLKMSFYHGFLGMAIGRLLLYSNAAINPFIYCAVSHSFRHLIVQSCKSTTELSYESTSRSRSEFRGIRPTSRQTSEYSNSERRMSRSECSGISWSTPSSHHSVETSRSAGFLYRGSRGDRQSLSTPDSGPSSRDTIQVPSWLSCDRTGTDRQTSCRRGSVAPSEQPRVQTTPSLILQKKLSRICAQNQQSHVKAENMSQHFLHQTVSEDHSSTSSSIRLGAPRTHQSHHGNYMYTRV